MKKSDTVKQNLVSIMRGLYQIISGLFKLSIARIGDEGWAALWVYLGIVCVFLVIAVWINEILEFALEVSKFLKEIT
jgi:hypothetical protein